MTIYTADQALNPEKKEQADVGVDIEIQISDEKKALTSEPQDDDYPVYHGTTMPVISANRVAALRRQQQIRRRNMWLLPLLLLGMIVGITMCIFGSMQLWNGMYYTSDQSFQGRCGVGIVDMSKYNATDRPQALRRAQKDGGQAKVTYYEDIKIDGPVETINVPKKGQSSPAIVRNDFDKNVTAIRDDLRALCILVPFLREFVAGMVPGPSNFSLYLKQIEIESLVPMVYEQDKFFQAIAPVADIDTEYGVPVKELCDGLRAYSAAETDKPTTKAPVTTTRGFETTTEGLPIDWFYTMYPGGDALYNYHMYFPTDLDLLYDL